MRRDVVRQRAVPKCLSPHRPARPETSRGARHCEPATLGSGHYHQRSTFAWAREEPRHWLGVPLTPRASAGPLVRGACTVGGHGCRPVPHPLTAARPPVAVRTPRSRGPLTRGCQRDSLLRCQDSNDDIVLSSCRAGRSTAGHRPQRPPLPPCEGARPASRSVQQLGRETRAQVIVAGWLERAQAVVERRCGVFSRHVVIKPRALTARAHVARRVVWGKVAGSTGWEGRGDAAGRGNPCRAGQCVSHDDRGLGSGSRRPRWSSAFPDSCGKIGWSGVRGRSYAVDVCRGSTAGGGGSRDQRRGSAPASRDRLGTPRNVCGPAPSPWSEAPIRRAQAMRGSTQGGRPWSPGGPTIATSSWSWGARAVAAKAHAGCGVV